MHTKIAALFVPVLLLSILISSGCGIKGNPQAPIPVNIPDITDLKGKLSGNSVMLSWRPSFQYTNGTDLQLRSVEIYRFEDDLSDELAEVSSYSQGSQGFSHLGPLNLRARLINQVPVTNFSKNSSLVTTIPVERMLEMTSQGLVHWSETLSTKPESLPTSRVVYAIREVDAKGRKSGYSNTTSILPLPNPAGPGQFEPTLSQDNLVLTWTFPDRTSAESQELSLDGFYLYAADDTSALPLAPSNNTSIKTVAPVAWLLKGITSSQQIKGTRSQYGYLLSTVGLAIEASINQTLLTGNNVGPFRGTTVEFSMTIKNFGEEGNGRVIIDASRDPISTDPSEGKGIIADESNPLIKTEIFTVSSEPRKFSFSWIIPADAYGLTLRIEPRTKQAVAASFVIESVSLRQTGSDYELVKNGTFDSFGPVSYTEPVSEFGKTRKFALSAIYSLQGFKFESEQTAIITVPLLDTFPPDTPAGLKVQATFDSVVVSWNAAKASDVAGYLVYRREGSKGAWKKITNKPLRATVYRDNDIEAGKSYGYRVETVDNEGNRSAPTAAISATVTAN